MGARFIADPAIDGPMLQVCDPTTTIAYSRFDQSLPDLARARAFYPGETIYPGKKERL
jgi:hypothetical protein